MVAAEAAQGDRWLGGGGGGNEFEKPPHPLLFIKVLGSRTGTGQFRY